MEQQTIDDFDRKWLELITPLTWVDATYALIGLTRLGEQPTTVEQLAAVLDRSQEEAIELAWEASRVRPRDGRIHLNAPFGGSGGPVRRKVYVGDREIPVSGCAPDLFPAAAVLDVPFRVEDTCSATGVPIQIEFTPEGRSSPPLRPHRGGSTITPAAACSPWRRCCTGPSSLSFATPCVRGSSPT